MVSLFSRYLWRWLFDRWANKWCHCSPGICGAGCLITELKNGVIVLQVSMALAVWSLRWKMVSLFSRYLWRWLFDRWANKWRHCSPGSWLVAWSLSWTEVGLLSRYLWRWLLDHWRLTWRGGLPDQQRGGAFHGEVRPQCQGPGLPRRCVSLHDHRDPRRTVSKSTAACRFRVPWQCPSTSRKPCRLLLFLKIFLMIILTFKSTCFGKSF